MIANADGFTLACEAWNSYLAITRRPASQRTRSHAGDVAVATTNLQRAVHVVMRQTGADFATVLEAVRAGSQ